MGWGLTILMFFGDKSLGPGWAQAQAQGLFALGKPLLAADRPADAYRLLFESLHHDPTHAEATKILALPKGPARKPRATLARSRQGQLGWPARPASLAR